MGDPDEQALAFQETDPRGGFTLVELLVVLVILGLVTALSGPVLSRFGSQSRLDGFVENLAATVNTARSRAVAASTIVSLRFDPEQRVIESDVPSRLPIPAGIAVRFTPPAGRKAASGVLRLLPDGRSSGGEIEVVSGRQVRVVTVARLTGTLDVASRNGTP